MSMKIEFDFEFGDTLAVNGGDVRGVVTGVTVRPAGGDAPDKAHSYAVVELSWFAHGDVKTAWIESWRLSEV